TVEMAYEIGARNQATLPRLRGAFALIQKGFSNSALRFLKEISVQEWRQLPEDQERFGEIVALFQKKVPLEALPGRLDQLDASKASPYLRDEILYARGREAFDRRQVPAAKSFLGAVSKRSRYYGEARYLLGSLAITAGDFSGASAEFSKVFEPAVF